MNHVSNFDAERALRALDLGKPVSPDHFAAAMALALDRADDDVQERLEEAQTESYKEGKAEFEGPYSDMRQRADDLYDALDGEALPMLRELEDWIQGDGVTDEASKARARLAELIDKLEGVLEDE